MSNKTFKDEFEKFARKVQNKEPFAFSRFSDGELFILQNKEVQLARDFYITGKERGYGVYTEEEQKHFKPNEHQFYREKLVECLKYKQDGYYKGICTRSDVSQENFDFQLNLHGGDDESLTYANLFINSNYPRYINEVVPWFKHYNKIYLVANKASSISTLIKYLDLDTKQQFMFFPVGNNCLINDYSLVNRVADILKNDEGSLLLCSASTLSNYIIHESFKLNNKNTLIDIGSSLNPVLRLEGWKYSRGYLQHWWLGMESKFATKEEYW